MNRPLKVLWLVKGLGRGGAERLVVDLASVIDRTQVELSVAYVLAHKDALVHELRELQVPVLCLSEGGRWPRQLRRLLRDGKFDVVHTHSPVVASAARLLAPRSTILVHTEHNMWARYKVPTRAVNALTAHRNRIIWAVSAEVGASVRPVRFGQHVPEVRVLLHGLPDAPSASSTVDRFGARERLGLPLDAFVVGSVGNLTVKKDHDTLVDAFALLYAGVPAARLVLVGGGPRHAHLQRLVAERGLTGVVTITGVRDDVPKLLGAFDVFAMSSRFEGLPIALLEAMSAGVPPVVTAVGGIPEVVTHGIDGLLAPASDPDALAALLRRTASDPDLRNALGAAARTRAKAFGIRPAAEALAAAYTMLTVPASRSWAS